MGEWQFRSPIEVWVKAASGNTYKLRCHSEGCKRCILLRFSVRRRVTVSASISSPDGAGLESWGVIFLCNECPFLFLERGGPWSLGVAGVSELCLAWKCIRIVARVQLSLVFVQTQVLLVPRYGFSVLGRLLCVSQMFSFTRCKLQMDRV